MLDFVSDMSLSREGQSRQSLALLENPSPLIRLVTLQVTFYSENLSLTTPSLCSVLQSLRKMSSVSHTAASGGPLITLTLSIQVTLLSLILRQPRPRLKVQPLLFLMMCLLFTLNLMILIEMVVKVLFPQQLIFTNL